MKLTRTAFAAAALAFAAFAAPQAFAAQPDVFANAQNVAINGYDAVAYFSGKPQIGDAKYQVTYKDAIFRFANAENAAKFKANPEAFAPQFGGYCAYGVAKDHKAPTDPQAFSIVDGKLYLNYNPKVKELWEQDRAENIRTANENWKEIKDQN